MSETTIEKKPNLAERTTGDLVKAAMSGWLGTALEFMDFQLYSLAAALVFSDLFFSSESPGVAVMSAMAIYGVGYIARPIGAWYFGRMGDRVGRKKVLFITITMMGVSTTLIGALPTFHQVGWIAPALLVVLRLIQGFGAGAEISGAAVMLAEYAPKDRRGIISSLVALGTNSGTLFAGLVWAILTAVMSDETLLSWGWRIPFLGSIIIMAFAIFIRLHLKETPVFEATQEEIVEAYDVPLSQRSVVTKPAKQKISPKAFAAAFFLRFGQSGNSGMVQTYLISFLSVNLFFSKSVASSITVLSSLVGFLTVPLIGWLGDRYGRRTIYRAVTSIGIIIIIPCLYFLVNSMGTHTTEAVVDGVTTQYFDRPALMFYIAYIVLHNITVLSLFSLENITMAELFGSKRRYEALALSKEIPNMVTAGFGPFIAASLVTLFSGSWIPLAILMFVYTGAPLITTFFMPEVAGRDLTDPKDAM
ncbi:MFS transporter [Changpingibacter yushuensis]|uniref:MFS transporter n=1 Tax=Changpingibacter yushuensis TaxID=2758440 RepID=UPI00165E69E6|nr:MFS transporter [Changpingibacter yushuensis]